MIATPELNTRWVMLKLLSLCILDRNLNELNFSATVQGSKKRRKTYTQIHFHFSFPLGFLFTLLSTGGVVWTIAFGPENYLDAT